MIKTAFRARDEVIKATVDRIEGDWIILVPESGLTFQVPCSCFPGLSEGQIVSLSIELDEEGQKEANERITKIREGLNRVEL